MPTATIKYLGDLRTISVHTKSGSEIVNDAPIDNHGKGEAFSPTDMMCASLVSCMLISMAIAAQKNGFELGEASGEFTKIMVDDPRRVGEIRIALKLSAGFTDEQKAILEDKALNCPVAKSLSGDLKQVLEFKY